MQILYRYIFGRAVTASVFVVMTCCVIASLINLFDILDEVVKQKVTIDLLFRYLMVNLAPRMIDLLNVMMVLAGLFTMGELGRRLELEAMRAAGLSDSKLLSPILMVAVLVFGTVLYGEISPIPHLLQKAELLKTSLKKGGAAATDPLESPFYVQLDNVALQAARYSADIQELIDVRLTVFEAGRVSEVFEAKKFGKEESGWVWTAGVFRKMDPLTGQVIKYHPFEKMDYPSRFPPAAEFLFEAQHRKSSVQWMSFSDLMAERSFAARQEIHKRLALSFSTAVGLFVGAWFGMKMQRFNAARAICLAILIGFTHRLIFDGFLAVGVETGASWACHLANLFLASSVVFAPFLTAPQAA